MMLKVEKPGSPMGNKTLRQALAFGINKRAIGEFLFQGNCKATETYYQPGHWVYDVDSADRYRFDPSRAKALVKDSGLANPTIRLMFDQGSTTSRPIAEAIADQVEREIGIRVQLDPRPNGALLPAWQANEVDAYVGQLSGTANIDPENFLNSYFVPNPSTGLQLGADPAALGRLAVSAANPGLTLAQRATAYKPIFDGIQESVPFVAICNQVQSYPKPAGSKLKGKVVAWWSGLPDYRNLYVTK